ncbi:ComEA family DNA-binding protein [Paenibacillus kobensis]|uniref:ComEA family DNA-binding protein n=1 Tax=Paenibacillus kobensis TaxID=59841 RepID=UPI001C3FEA13|nr:ComEA family DNA-binding protein [Paenibacillus kobensis]
MADLRAAGMRMKFALLCAAAGVLLIGLGMWKHQQMQTDQWQPLNGQLNEALVAAEQQHTSVQSLGGENRSGDSGQQGAATVKASEDAKTSPGASVESANSASTAGAVGSIDDRSEQSLDAGAVPVHPGAADSDTPAPSGTTVSPEADGRLDLNRATAEQLDELPGIGPAKAAAIIADREASGPFRSVDDLARVKGIGPAIVGKLRDSVVALP